jgi:hypothetical protein
MAEFVKDRASFNEAIKGQSRSRNRGQKSYHHGNGNGNYNDSNPDADPDASAQHMERARSSPSSQLLSSTMANTNGQATQNSVLQSLPQLLNDEFLLEFNSLNHPAQLDQQMIQERWQQQQLAWEEAAKLKERVDTALAKAIGWAIAASSRPDLDQADPLPVPKKAEASSRPDLEQADPLPVPTTGGSPGGDRNVEVPKNSRNQGPSNAGEGPQGRHGGRHAPKRSSNPSYGPRRPGLAAAQHQSI